MLDKNDLSLVSSGIGINIGQEDCIAPISEVLWTTDHLQQREIQSFRLPTKSITFMISVLTMNMQSN